MRLNPEGFIFESKGGGAFPKNKDELPQIISFCNSKIINYFLSVLAPTMDYSQGPVGKVPFKKVDKNKMVFDEAKNIAKADWDSTETSWDFDQSPFIKPEIKAHTIEKSFKKWSDNCKSKISQLRNLEIQNNLLFIEEFGLKEELQPDVSEDEITHIRAKLETDLKHLISYAVGCMMGRYSLDEPGLVYANSGSEGFDPSKYRTFPADDDGIIPIMDRDWFADDAANRFVEFLKVAWPPETLDENLQFVASCLKPKRNETSIDTIRRYLSTSFFKDHLKTYKKRPIYWMFSSGRQKSFECLVYLHRYNESTLSRMRSTYVTPLQGNFSARLESLQNEKDAASTASAQKKFQKEMDTLKKKQSELSKFDDALRHYADMKISLDLDDGVKVNYGKFGGLLAEKKAITGKK
jgi:type II restriction/modification system DNA methylase subunit YeeA